MIIVPFVTAHLNGFKPQEKQGFTSKYLMNEDYVTIITDYSEAYTGLVNGNPVAIAGVFQANPHVGQVWAFLGDKSHNHMLGVTRHIMEWLSKSTIPRLETAVHREFLEAHRWANMLGFTKETNENGMINYGANGEIYDLYARYN